MPSITIRGGRVEIELTNGRVIVSPPDHFIVHDDSGQVLDSCTLYIGPATLTDEPVDRLTPKQRAYFGSGYKAHKALLDLPKKGWKPLGEAAAITFFRRGRYDGDWHHKFSSPQPLFKSDGWLKLTFPATCKLTHKGIEKP